MTLSELSKDSSFRWLLVADLSLSLSPLQCDSSSGGGIIPTIIVIVTEVFAARGGG